MGKDQELLTASRLGDISKVERLVKSQNHSSSSSWNLAHTFRYVYVFFIDKHCSNL